jgi:hypothetical protein
VLGGGGQGQVGRAAGAQVKRNRTSARGGELSTYSSSRNPTPTPDSSSPSLTPSSRTPMSPAPSYTLASYPSASFPLSLTSIRCHPSGLVSSSYISAHSSFPPLRSSESPSSTLPHTEFLAHRMSSVILLSELPVTVHSRCCVIP